MSSMLSSKILQGADTPMSYVLSGKILQGADTASGDVLQKICYRICG